MKKILSMILAAVLALALMCSAAGADDIPQPEGGRKFESNWAIFGMTVAIIYEEEGYRVGIESYNPAEYKGTVWEYSCYYSEEKDILQSVSSLKYDYTVDPETYDRKDGEPEYDGLDDEKTMTVFAIDENGMLIWEDGHGQDGMDLEFTDIGDFEGEWQSADGNVRAEIDWDDAEDNYGYTAWIQNGTDEAYTEYYMSGLYNPETEKLELEGTATQITVNTEGVPETGEPNNAAIVLSFTEAGTLLLEGENPVEMEYSNPDLASHG